MILCDVTPAEAFCRDCDMIVMTARQWSEHNAQTTCLSQYLPTHLQANEIELRLHMVGFRLAISDDQIRPRHNYH